jgi:hypothetical protein
MKSTAGLVQVRGGDMVGGASANGFEITGGTARLSNLRLNTAANSSTSPVTKSGGTLYLEGTILVAEGTRDSISAPTAQNVVALGAWANRAVDADVTITTEGGLVIDSAVA